MGTLTQYPGDPGCGTAASPSPRLGEMPPTGKPETLSAAQVGRAREAV